MKKTSKLIVMSILTIAMCVSLIAGATFALFTSESKTNIAITSGKVNVSATVQEESLKTYSYEQDETGNFTSQEQEANSFVYGSASFADGTLTLENIVPGDKAEFNIVLTNTSTIAVKYQIKVGVEGSDALYRALKISGLEEGLKSSVFSSAKLSDWQDLEVGSEPISLPIVVELPYGYNDNIVNGNEESSIQGKSVTLTFTVNAVQANAKTENPVEADPAGATLPVYDAEDFKNFCELMDENDRYQGKTVTLASDLVLNNDWTPINGFLGTFDGNGHNVTLSYDRELSSGSASVQFAMFGNVSGEVKNLTVSGDINIKAPQGAVINLSELDVGGVCAETGGNVSGCVNKANITVDLSGAQSAEIVTVCVGGVAARSGAKGNGIEGCVNEGDIKVIGVEKLKGEVVVGGICSMVMPTGSILFVVNNVKNTGSVTMDHENTLEVETFACGDIIGLFIGDYSKCTGWEYVGSCSIGACMTGCNIQYGQKIEA